jgi:hypothetical protein
MVSVPMGIEEKREAVRARLNARIPSWYSPWAHLAVPSTIALAAIGTALALIHDLHPVQLLTIPICFLISNASEWRLHRDVLHKRLPGASLLYYRHTPEHHVVFQTDTMQIANTREFRLVLIPAYGIIGIAIANGGAAVALSYFGHHNVGMLVFATNTLYAVSYEWLHLSYHLPPDGFVGRMGIIRRLRQHHATHHNPTLMQKWNFNVTIPLWDWVRRTIYRPELEVQRK